MSKEEEDQGGRRDVSGDGGTSYERRVVNFQQGRQMLRAGPGSSYQMECIKKKK